MNRSAEEPREPLDWFGEPLSRQGLKRRSVRGSIVSSAGHAVTQVVRLGSLMLLARLLVPADFGLIAMITAVVGISSVLQDVGLSAATIRARTITHDQISNLFWINLVLGIAMTGLVALAAPALESYYRHPHVASATVAMALQFTLGGAAIQHLSLLRRNMQFSLLARITLLSAAAVAAVSIAGAVAGLAHWALIAGALTGHLVTCLLAWSHCNWRPGRPRRHAGTRALLTFGWHMLVFGILGFVAKNVHSLLIGRLWGGAEAGLYSRAEFLRRLVAGNIARPLGLVAPVSMARLRDEPERYCAYYVKCTSVAVMLCLPVAFLGLVLPHEIIAILLGPQWQRTADLLQILALSVLPQVLLNTTGWVYLSGGNSVLMMWWGAAAWSLLICAVVVGANFGISGIAWATTIASWLLVVPGLWLAYRGTPLTIGGLISQLISPVTAGLIATAIAMYILTAVDLASAPARLALGGAVFMGLYLTLLLTVFGQRPLLADIIDQLRSRRRSIDS